MASLELNHIADLEEIPAAEWDALSRRSRVNTIFQSYCWNTAWWRTYSDIYDSAIVTVRQDDVLVAVAPLVIDSSKVLRFLGAGASDYCDFLVAQDSYHLLPMVFDAIAQLNWKSADLTGVHQDSPLLEHISSLQFDIAPQAPAPSYQFCGNPQEDSKLANKKSLRRHYNQFQKHGELRLEILQSACAANPHLEGFFDQHIKRRALAGDDSRFLKQADRELYRELVYQLGKAGVLRFAVLHYNSDILAYHLGFEFNGTFYWYKPTFNVDYAKKSPGEVLIKLLIEHCIEAGVEEFDFTIGGESFKYRFANQERTVFRIKLFRSELARLRFRLVRSARAYARRLATLGTQTLRRTFAYFQSNAA